MERKVDVLKTEIVRFSYHKDGKEIGRASLVIIKNDLHAQPYGLLEDVFVTESHRGQGIASRLVGDVDWECVRQGCYKLICTSRFAKEEVHNLYERLGFHKHGFEFRMDL